MGIVVGVNLLNDKDKEYIEIDVPPYPIGISCKGIYYYRSGSTRQVLTGPALEAFLMRKRGATWDNLPLPAFSLEDVNDELLDRFKQWGIKKGRIDQSVLDEPKNILMEKLHLKSCRIGCYFGRLGIHRLDMISPWRRYGAATAKFSKCSRVLCSS